MCVIIASLLHSPSPPSLTHSLTHMLYLSFSFTHSLIHSLSHSLTHSLTHSFIHSFIYSLTHSFIHSLTYSLTHCLTHSLTVSLTHSFTYSLTHSFFTNTMFIIIDRYYSLKYMNKLKCFTIFCCYHFSLSSLSSQTLKVFENYPEDLLQDIALYSTYEEVPPHTTCKRETERERERDRQTERETEREREIIKRTEE